MSALFIVVGYVIGACALAFGLGRHARNMPMNEIIGWSIMWPLAALPCLIMLAAIKGARR